MAAPFTPEKNFVGRFNRIDPQVYTSAAFNNLPPQPPNARTLLIFLMTGTLVARVPGVVIAGPATIAEMLRWSVKATTKALAELVSQKLVFFDALRRTIWIPRVLEDNPPMNPSMVTGWQTTLHELQDGPLKQTITKALFAYVSTRGKGFVEAFLAACPADTVSDTVSDAVSETVPDTSNRNQEPRTRIRKIGSDTPKGETTSPNQGQRTGSGSGPGLVGSGSPSGSHPVQELPGQGQETGLVGSGSPAATDRFPAIAEGPGPWSGQEKVNPAAPVNVALFLADLDDEFAGLVPDDQPAAAVKTILDRWNALADAVPVFERVEGRAASALHPLITALLADDDAPQDFNDVLEIAAVDPWYQGGGDRKFVIFLRWLVTDLPRLHTTAAVARKKLARLHATGSKKPAYVAQSEARRRAGKVSTFDINPE